MARAAGTAHGIRGADRTAKAFFTAETRSSRRKLFVFVRSGPRLPRGRVSDRSKDLGPRALRGMGGVRKRLADLGNMLTHDAGAKPRGVRALKESTAGTTQHLCGLCERKGVPRDQLPSGFVGIRASCSGESMPR